MPTRWVSALLFKHPHLGISNIHSSSAAPARVGGAALALGGALLLGAMPPAVPAAGATFSCEMAGSVPATVASTPAGPKTVIRWVSGYFSESGYTPLTRCKEVSERFQTYMNQGLLNYITTGYMNNQPVVCVTSSNGGGCQGLLFTLKSGENASRVLQQLFEVKAGAAGPLNESSERLYIDVNQMLGTGSGGSQGTAPPRPSPSGATPAGGGSLW